MMVVVEEKPVPIYETKCGECKSVIRYGKSEVGVTHYITCPVCKMSIWADMRTPVDYWEGELSEGWTNRNADKIDPEIDMLIRSALDAGATVRKVKPGDGGIFVNGRRLTDDNLEECILNPKPPTNADRIRAMSDEELAELFEMIPHSGNPPTYTIDGFCIDEGLRTKSQWLDWLREEVEA